jgi:hypothetical protein
MSWRLRLGIVDEMPIPSLPAALAGRVFDRRIAADHGLSPGVLRGPRIAPVFGGVYRYRNTDLTPALLAEAALLIAPPDAVVCRTSALTLWGLDLVPPLPVHLATNTSLRRRRDEIMLHRHQGTITPYFVRGTAVTGPDRTFVDCGTMLSLAQLVAAGDWLVARGLTDVAQLHGYALKSHLNGVQMARFAAELVRPASESPRESMVRVVFVAWGLPEPQLNVNVHDADGRFLARGDLVLEEWRVIVEYDGWYHERGAAQRQRDILRREALEAAGWLVVVLTSRDLEQPRSIAWRAYNALRIRGYRGTAPQFDSANFGRWMQPNRPIYCK